MLPVASVALVYVVASGVAFVLYGLDKRRAARGGRRVPERTLHVVELLGGWPGALAASAAFRHKTKKRGFRVMRGLIVGLHVALWIAWFVVRG